MALDSKDIADLSGLIAQLNESIKLTEELRDVLVKDIGDALKGFKGAPLPVDSKGLKDYEKATQNIKAKTEALNTVNAKRHALAEEDFRLKKKQLKAQAQLIKGSRKVAKETAIINEKRRQQNKALKEQAKLELGLVNAYDLESKRLRELRKDYKGLAASGKQNTKQAREMLKTITELDAKLKGIDATVGQFQRNVGNYAQGLEKLRGGIRNLQAIAGVAGGAFMLNRAIRGGVDIIRDFEQANANLASILGTNRENISALTDDARRLGSSTIFTASQVSQLQTEFAKLGFSEQEILNTTEATLQLAAATGSELSEAANVAGATVRGFGLTADETQRVVDIMAKSFSLSALDMEKFSTAMSAVAPVAKSAGVSVERTTALLGTLVNRGIDASTAGTGLRNVFLELSKSGMTFEEAMSEINGAADKNAKALELFGKRGATIGTILSETGAEVDNLNDRLEQAGGTAEKMAKEQMNTLDGALKALNSKWEGLILGADESSDISGQLAEAVEWLTDNLEDIIKTVITAASAFASFKAGVISVQAVQNAGNALKLLKSSIMGTTDALKKMNAAQKANAIGLITAAVGAAIAAYKLWIEEGEETVTIQEEIADVTQKAAASVAKEEANLKLLISTAQDENLTREQRQKAIDELQKTYPDYLSNLTIENANSQEIAKSTNELVAALRRKAQIQALNNLLQEKAQKRQEIELALENELQGLRVKGDDIVSRLARGTDKNLRNEIDLLREGEDAIIAKIQALEAEAIAANNNLGIKEDDTDATEANTKAQKTQAQILKEKMDAEIALAEKLMLTQKRLNVIQFKDTKERRERDIKAELDFMRTKMKILIKFGEFSEKLALDIENKRLELQKARIDRYVKAEEDAIKKVDAANKKAEEERERTNDANFDQEMDLLDRQQKEKELALLQSNKTEEEIQQESIDNQIDALEKEIEIRKAHGKETIDQELKLAELRRKKQDQQNQAQLEQQKDFYQTLQGLADAYAENQRRQDQEALDAIDKQIEAVRKRQADFRQIAAEQGLDADKSIAAEIKREERLEREKRKIQERAARRELYITAFKTYSAKVENNDPSPLTSTLTDLALLTAAISGLSAFYDGTDTTIGDALGNTGTRDGHIIRAHDNEHIIGAKDSEKLHKYGLFRTKDIVDNAIAFESNRTATPFENLGFESVYNIVPRDNGTAAEIRALGYKIESQTGYLEKIANKPVYLGKDFNKTAKAVYHFVLEQGKITKQIEKLSDLDW